MSTDTRNAAKPAQYRSPEYRALRSLWRLSNPPCWICGQLGADTVDHVVPLSQGGTNSLDNLRPAHRECNSRRGVRNVEEEEREYVRLGVTRVGGRRTGARKFYT